MRAFIERRRRTVIDRFQRLFDGWASKRARHPSLIRLDHKTIYVLPTGFGLAWVVLFVGIWIGGANYDNNAARFLAWWLLSILFIAPYLSFRYLASVEIRLLDITEACHGEQAQLTLSVHGHRSTISVQLSDHPWQHVGVDRSRISSHFTVPQRGRYDCPVIRVETRLPFGMFRCWSVIRFTTPGLGYPTPIVSTIAPTRQAESEESETHVSSLTKAQGNDFDSLKRYEVGEPLARVDWKALAKTEQMYSKLYGQAIQAQRRLDIDALTGDTERRLGILCYWILKAHESEQAVGLVLGEESFPENTGDAHITRLLRALANYPGTDNEL